MRGHGPVFCKPNQIGTPQQTIWIKRGGKSSSGSGLTGYKMKPARRLARAMAEMARAYRSRKKV